jgi:hypothetical protein
VHRTPSEKRGKLTNGLCQSPEITVRESLRPVDEGGVRMRVDVHQQPIGTNGNCGTRQRNDELAAST